MTTSEADVTSAEARPSRIESWFAALPPWAAWGLAFASGALAATGYAPLQFAPGFVIGFVALIWLLNAAHRRPRRLASFFARGWFWGVGHCLAGMYWIASPFMVDPTSWGVLWAAPSTAAFVGGLALFYGAGAWLAGLAWTPDLRRLPTIALAFAVTEWLRGRCRSAFAIVDAHLKDRDFLLGKRATIADREPG